MRLGFSSNAFKKFSLEQCIPLVSQIGYSAVEILCDVPHAYPIKAQDVAGIRALLSSNNLEISNLNTFTLYAIRDTYHPSWIEEANEMRQIRLEHTINCIELASKLGCKNISTEAGGPFFKETNNQAVLMRRFIKEINAISRIAEQHGVKVLIEPEPGLLLETSRDFLSFIKNIKSDYIRIIQCMRRPSPIISCNVYKQNSRIESQICYEGQYFYRSSSSCNSCVQCD